MLRQESISSYEPPKKIEVYGIQPENDEYADEILCDHGYGKLSGTKYLFCDEIGVVARISKFLNLDRYIAEVLNEYNYAFGGKDVIGGATRAGMNIPKAYSSTTFIDDRSHFDKFEELIGIEANVSKDVVLYVPNEDRYVSKTRKVEGKLFVHMGSYEI